MAAATLSLLLLLAWVCPAASGVGDFDHHDRGPRVRWSADLSSTLLLDAFAAGGAVHRSPDGTRLYMTTLKGSVVSMELNGTYAEGAGPAYRYLPPDRDTGWSTKCRTGVAFSLMTIDRPFFVYGVEDEPPVFSDETAEPTSRIVAMNHPFNEGDDPRWISEPLVGVISGTPVISSDGRFVFVAHNYNKTQGHFSVLQVGRQRARLLFTGTTDDAKGPYAPLAIAHNPDYGKYPGGEQNRNDIIVWGHQHIKDDDVNWEYGWIHAFQFSTVFDGNSVGGEQIYNLQDVSWSTLTRPVITSTGQRMYFATSKSEARGWWSPEDKFNNKATWKVEDLIRDESRQLKALPGDGGPCLSPKGDLLFTTSTTNAVYALSASAGLTIWLDSSMPSIVRTEPHVSPDSSRVYFMGSDGTIVSKRTSDGVTQWKFQAEATDTLAEFDLSPDGTTLFYAGNRGTDARFVYALAVADFETAKPTSSPTLPPTPVPTTRVPTGVPSVSPTRVPSAQPTSNPTAVPSTMAPTPSEPTTASPTDTPTFAPSSLPTSTPPASEAPTSAHPTAAPTSASSPSPTDGVLTQSVRSSGRRDAPIKGVILALNALVIYTTISALMTSLW